jgi:hypothetical protein
VVVDRKQVGGAVVVRRDPQVVAVVFDAIIAQDRRLEFYGLKDAEFGNLFEILGDSVAVPLEFAGESGVGNPAGSVTGC